MNDGERAKLGTDPYKGTRDFYPEDQFVLRHLFSAMRKVAEQYGYVEYGGPTIEPAELYASKSSEEIVRDQIYSFTDRGGRLVTLRPEMTPTVARMVAKKRRDLPLPIRWYSIPNFFRYEQPQKGRLREHFQINVDCFGIESIEADIENIAVASGILRNLGAQESDFIIRIGSRKFLSSIFASLSLSPEEERTLSRLIDRKEKIPQDEYESVLHEIVGDDAGTLLSLLDAEDLGEFLQKAPPHWLEKNAMTEVENVLLGLRALGIENARFNPSLVRGFDYYSGIVFEIFDTNPENRRSIAGGGRYDNLLSIFGEPPISAVGFGMGDVTLKEFLESRNLLPPYRPPTRLAICKAPDASSDFLEKIASQFRTRGVNTSVDYTDRKIGDQIRSAVKQRIPFLICVGKREEESGMFALKHLDTEEEVSLLFEDAVSKILRSS